MFLANAVYLWSAAWFNFTANHYRRSYTGEQLWHGGPCYAVKVTGKVRHDEEGTHGPSRAQQVLLVLAFVLLAANLRPALTSVAPLIGQISTDTEISNGVAGLL